MIQTLYKQRQGNDPAADQLLNRLRRVGYQKLPGLKIERVLRLEGLDEQKASIIWPIFFNSILETTSTHSALDLAAGPVVEISYQRGITDPELTSIMHAAESLGVSGLKWARLATRYQFPGVNEITALEIAKRMLFNREVETIIPSGEEWPTLMPQGETGKVELIDLRSMDMQAMLSMSDQRRLFMLENQLLAAQNFFRETEIRPARDGEIEMIAASWGDHCKHTTMNALGCFAMIKRSTAAINHPLVISAFDDNSGVMRLYAGWAINLKGETHIGPGFIATYGGIMTKHGGVIRDIIFTGQGGYPIAGTTIMAICDPRLSWEEIPEGSLHPQIVLLESIRGTWQYTNPMGIPMAWSQYLKHPRNVKGFALGHSVGIIPEKRAKKGEPRPGDLVVYIGGKTGNDGLHGSTFSSSVMTHETARKDGSSVQIGMPIEERKFMEAIPVLRDANCVHAETDCGAAGLESAVGELGSETGVWTNLFWVPLKCAGMAPWGIWLSESQERGVLAVPPGKLSLTRKILRKYNVPAVVIGVFTDTKRCQVVYDDKLDNASWLANPTTGLTGEIVVDLPYSFLKEDCPLPNISIARPAPKIKESIQWPKSQTEWLDLIQHHLGHFNISDQSTAAHQYDQTVEGATVLTYVGGKDERMPDELFACTPVEDKPYVAGIANTCNQFYGDVDPYGQGQLLMVQAMAKLVAAGFSPDDITCNVNLYTPRVVGFPEHAWALKQLVRGYTQAAKGLGMPVISGKDSCSGSFGKKDGTFIHAPLTLDVLAVGRMPNECRLIPKAFSRPGDKIIIYHPGLREKSLGGSILLDLFDERGNRLPRVNVKEARKGFAAYHSLLKKKGWGKRVRSRSAIGEGGLIRRLFEMSIGNGLGCDIYLPAKSNNEVGRWLFSELSGAIIFTVDSNFYGLSDNLGNRWVVLGTVADRPGISIWKENGEEIVSAETKTLGELWSKTFAEVAL
jgi:phosphoribosylformylglycinamidine synthase subunit PurSL